MTLEEQYRKYIEENKDSVATFIEWLKGRSEFIEMSERDIYVSDDFQIGPDGAYEHVEEENTMYTEAELMLAFMKGYDLATLETSEEKLEAEWEKFIRTIKKAHE